MLKGEYQNEGWLSYLWKLPAGGGRVHAVCRSQHNPVRNERPATEVAAPAIPEGYGIGVPAPHHGNIIAFGQRSGFRCRSVGRLALHKRLVQGFGSTQLHQYRNNEVKRIFHARSLLAYGILG